MRAMSAWMAWWSLFQHVEAARQAVIGGAEDREVMQVLDLVMHVELLQQELQPRHQQARETPAPAAGRRGNRRSMRLDHAGKLAEHGVARQPEARHLAEIGVGLPLLARVALDAARASPRGQPLRRASARAVVGGSGVSMVMPP